MSNSVPRRRADAQRNRDRLLRAASEAFAAVPDPSLEAIAGRAGVGIGTLYRNFPTREALVEAVYRTELASLCDDVGVLLASSPDPAAALRTWVDRYVDFVLTKRGMAQTLRALLDDGVLAAAATRTAIDAAVATMLGAGIAAGTFRRDLRADDVVTSMVGIVLATQGDHGRARVGRLLDLLFAGVTAPPAVAHCPRQ